MGNSSKKEAAEGGEGGGVAEEGGQGEMRVEENEEEEDENTSKEEEEPQWDQELPIRVEDDIEAKEMFLNMSYCRMYNLPTRICSLTYLVKLYLSNNRLQTLPKSLAQLQGLHLLALDQNKMDDLPVVVCELVNLTHLYVSNNKLMTLPVEMVNLRKLRCLWLDGNYFMNFPRLLMKLPNLNALQLGDNMLRTLPNDLWCMSALRCLWLYGNRFKKFPHVLLRMEAIEVLDFDSNRLTKLPELDHMPALRLFSYDHNMVKYPPLVREEALVVGRGADLYLEKRQKKKDDLKKAAQTEAKTKAEMDHKTFLRMMFTKSGTVSSGMGPEQEQEPIIHGILKNSTSFDRRPNSVADGMAEGTGRMKYDGEQEELLYEDGMEYIQDPLVYQGSTRQTRLAKEGEEPERC
ncbi:leucine-rich repeat-containing protein 10B-like [Brienomyrus brachyistius]|uniref:leucine-rich repeat-containing protein 10B-like n=1 Tax=Brienomyrus brachyistius TaxID=42636 RepID=UPI0020B27E55|nr:leucine-rich repeat-containing protein 10B-like [Brienomyrus brachyistius]